MLVSGPEPAKGSLFSLSSKMRKPGSSSGGEDCEGTDGLEEGGGTLGVVRGFLEMQCWEREEDGAAEAIGGKEA
jgi:hypothetical protein